jgi:hypothetical protein
VTITGSGFTGATAVRFGSAIAGFTVVNDTQISTTSPPGSGTVHVTVTTTAGVSPTSVADQFNYTAPIPVVTKVSPTQGPIKGGTAVTITGSGFTGATAVTFNGGAATFVVDPHLPDTQINATSPRSTDPTGGVVDIRVTTPGGTSATSRADMFEYTDKVI